MARPKPYNVAKHYLVLDSSYPEKVKTQINVMIEVCTVTATKMSVAPDLQ